MSSLAITCFGHLARLHQQVGDTSRIFQLLRDKHRSPVPDIRGAAEDAMDDISVFMGIDLRKKKSTGYSGSSKEPINVRSL